MNPSENFYLFVNKQWKIHNPIPEDKSRWSQFDILHEKVLLKLKDILENKLDKTNKLSKLYFQGFEKYNNINLIKKYLMEIDSINDINKLLELSVDYYLLFNINFLLKFYIFPDFNNSSKNILHIETTGLGLPSKEYYFTDPSEQNGFNTPDKNTIKNSEELEKIRLEYKKFIDTYTKLFNITLDADTIVNFEKILADKTFTSEQERDMDLINNISSYEEIINNYPNLKHLIDYYFNKINKPINEINIINLKFFKLINDLLINDQLTLLKDFLKFKLIKATHYFINEEIENTYCEFYEKKLSGKIILEPKWKKSIEKINSLLGQELGQYFIKYYYDKTNNNINIIIDYIFNIIKTSLENNSWLSDSTKKKALVKINKMNFKIAYPDKRGLYNYDLLLRGEEVELVPSICVALADADHEIVKQIETNEDNYFNNIILCIQYNKKLEYDQLYDQKNIYRWHMDPHTTNAYYSQSDNEFVIPAGILDEPFYFKDDIIKSFSGIGYIIGHEIIHAFDDKGRLFNENGNLKNWWTPEDNTKYITLSKKLIEQYNSYNVNGSLTLGENIADLGGVKFALFGLILFLINKKCKLKYKYFKRFFINYANCLASNIRDIKAKELLLTDSHSPNEYRVNGVLKNINIFLKVFNIKSGSMYLDKKDQLIIW